MTWTGKQPGRKGKELRDHDTKRMRDDEDRQKNIGYRRRRRKKKGTKAGMSKRNNTKTKLKKKEKRKGTTENEWMNDHKQVKIELLDYSHSVVPGGWNSKQKAKQKSKRKLTHRNSQTKEKRQGGEGRKKKRITEEKRLRLKHNKRSTRMERKGIYCKWNKEKRKKTQESWRATESSVQRENHIIIRLLRGHPTLEVRSMQTRAMRGTSVKIRWTISSKLERTNERERADNMWRWVRWTRKARTRKETAEMKGNTRRQSRANLSIHPFLPSSPPQEYKHGCWYVTIGSSCDARHEVLRNERTKNNGTGGRDAEMKQESKSQASKDRTKKETKEQIQKWIGKEKANEQRKQGRRKKDEEQRNKRKEWQRRKQESKSHPSTQTRKRMKGRERKMKEGKERENNCEKKENNATKGRKMSPKERMKERRRKEKKR